MIVAEIEANNVKVKELAGEGDKWRDSFRKRYEAEMIERFDTHFFVGTLNQYPSSWIIVGLFYPPKRTIRDLFERLAGYRAYPRDYDVAKDSSVRATITATALKLDVRVLLKQNKAWDLQNFPNLPTDAASRRVCFLVFWRKT